MKKLFKLVSMELQNNPQGPILQLHLTDWHPPTEQVNPLKERFKQIKETMKGKDFPKEALSLVEGLAELFDPSSYGYAMPNMAYYSTSVVSVTPKEYEELGKPLLGSILELEIRKTEEAD